MYFMPTDFLVDDVRKKIDRRVSASADVYRGNRFSGAKRMFSRVFCFGVIATDGRRTRHANDTINQPQVCVRAFIAFDDNANGITLRVYYHENSVIVCSLARKRLERFFYECGRTLMFLGTKKRFSQRESEKNLFGDS